MSDTNNHLNEIVKQLKRLNMRLSVPYALGVKFVSKTKGGIMANIMVYGVTAGSAGASDVVERRLTVTVNSEVVENRTYAGDVVDLGELKVAQDADVSLALVDVDDVGNISSPATYVFKATDSIAPPVPGSFGVNIIREE
jgi:hypothetical protein